MKNKMRQFSVKEKKLAQKTVDGLQAEVDHLTLMVEYNTFMLDKMLESNYLEKRRVFKKQSSEFEAEIKETQRTIDITTKQIEEGVETVDSDSQTDNIPGMVQ